MDIEKINENGSAGHEPITILMSTPSQQYFNSTSETYPYNYFQQLQVLSLVLA